MLRASAVSALFALALIPLGGAVAQAQQAPAREAPAPVVYPDLDFPALPYASRWIEVDGARMHYLEAGDPKGDPILLLHGQPTWSYLWRDVIPHLEGSGRVIAVDLIGFGRSDRPDGIEYRFRDHARYLEGFIDALELDDLTLVVHDWGSALGLDYAARHPDRIEGIAYFEAMVPPFVTASLADLPADLRDFFAAMRTDGAGQAAIMDQNVFVEGVLFGPLGTVAHVWTEEERNAYRAPFPTPEDRLPLWRWPQEVPFDGQPADVAGVVANYLAWMGRTDTPMLYLYALPGGIGGEPAAEWSRATVSDLEVVYLGEGGHFIQEDQPEALGRAVAEWIDRAVRR